MSLDLLNAHWQDWLAQERSLPPEAFVFGEGLAPGPLLMLVGEAPGAQETRQRRPFVGQAGKNLEGFLQVLQLPREAIYITNVVKVRPTKQGPTGRLSNRPPTREEVAVFLPWLTAECALVVPRLIVTLGNCALKAFLGQDAAIGACHGQAVSRPQGPVLFPLYHPAAVIYNRSLAHTCAQDVAGLGEYVKQMPSP